MSSEPQETAESSNFIAFDKTNNDDNRGYRSNFHQHRPYNRHQNYRQQNFRRNHHQQFGAAQNDGDAQFSPANFSSPVHQQRFNNRFHHRPQQMNQFQQRRNFVPFNKFGGNSNQTPKAAASIQQYFHKSMLEDPWTECHRYNGTDESTTDLTNEQPNADELNAETC